MGIAAPRRAYRGAQGLLASIVILLFPMRLHAAAPPERPSFRYSKAAALAIKNTNAMSAMDGRSCESLIHIVVTVGDGPAFSGDRMALLCESYLNSFTSVFVVTDTYEAFVVGSPARNACKSHIRVIRTQKNTKGQPQLARAVTIDRFLEEVPAGKKGRKEGTTPTEWAVFTGPNTWWEPRLLCKYVRYLGEMSRGRSKLVLGGAGTGKLANAGQERNDWRASIGGEEPQTPSAPSSAMFIASVKDMHLVFAKAIGGSAVSCRKRVLDFCAARREGPAQGCNIGGFKNITKNWFISCMARRAQQRSLKISAEWARRSELSRQRAYSVVNRFLFQESASDANLTKFPAMSLRWNNLVSVHRISDAFLRNVVRYRSREAAPWPTVFVIGNQKSASTSIHKWIVEHKASDVCQGHRLEGEPSYYNKETHGFDRASFNSSSYRSHFEVPADDEARCRRFIDSTPNYFSHYFAHEAREDGGLAKSSLTVMKDAIPPGIQAASMFIVSLREPVAYFLSYKNHGCGDGWLHGPKCHNSTILMQSELSVFNYKANLRRWFRIFGRVRFLVLQFENLEHSLRAIDSFLGFSPTATPVKLKKTNQGSIWNKAYTSSFNSTSCSERLEIATIAAPLVAGTMFLVKGLGQSQTVKSFGPPPFAQRFAVWEKWRPQLCDLDSNQPASYEDLLQHLSKHNRHENQRRSQPQREN